MGNLDFGCDGGWCTSNTYDSSYPQADAGFHGAIRTGLIAPGGLATDGIDVFYVDNGVLIQIENDGSSPITLATGVDASGGLVSDGINVYWAGGWSGNVDGGDLDGGSDADASDDAGDAGDDAGGTVVRIPGIYAVSVTGGDVRVIGAMSVLPTLAIDDTNAYARTPIDDAGTSVLAAYSLDGDGGARSLGTVSGNTESLHAFVPRATDVVALDRNAIISLPFDGGASAILTSNADAGSIELLGTTAGVASVSTYDLFSTLGLVGGDASPAGIERVGPVASFGNFVYFVADAWPIAIYRVDVTNPAAVTAITTLDTPVLYLAADATDVYWMTPGPSGAIYAARAH